MATGPSVGGCSVSVSLSGGIIQGGGACDMYFYMHTCIRTHVDIYKCGIYGIYVCMYMYMGGCSIVNNTNNTLVSDTPTPPPPHDQGGRRRAAGRVPPEEQLRSQRRVKDYARAQRALEQQMLQSTSAPKREARAGWPGGDQTPSLGTFLAGKERARPRDEGAVIRRRAWQLGWSRTRCSLPPLFVQKEALFWNAAHRFLFSLFR